MIVAAIGGLRGSATKDYREDDTGAGMGTPGQHRSRYRHTRTTQEQVWAHQDNTAA